MIVIMIKSNYYCGTINIISIITKHDHDFPSLVVQIDKKVRDGFRRSKKHKQRAELVLIAL